MSDWGQSDLEVIAKQRARIAALESELSGLDGMLNASVARIAALEAENAALRHDLSKSMANHVADINGD